MLAEGRSLVHDLARASGRWTPTELLGATVDMDGDEGELLRRWLPLPVGPLISDKDRKRAEQRVDAVPGRFKRGDEIRGEARHALVAHVLVGERHPATIPPLRKPHLALLRRLANRPPAVFTPFVELEGDERGTKDRETVAKLCRELSAHVPPLATVKQNAGAAITEEGRELLQSLPSPH